MLKCDKKDICRIVTVCDGDTWGDLCNTTVIEYDGNQSEMLDWADKLPREEYQDKDEEPWDYIEYDLDEYIHMKVMERLIRHGIKNEEVAEHVKIHGLPDGFIGSSNWEDWQ